MPVVAGLVWKTQVFNSSFGVLNWLLDSLGFERIEFRDPLAAVVDRGCAGVAVDSVHDADRAGRIAGPGPVGVGGGPGDGASSRAMFFQITLPQLRPYLELGILLGSIYLIQSSTTWM